MALDNRADCPLVLFALAVAELSLDPLRCDLAERDVLRRFGLFGFLLFRLVGVGSIFSAIRLRYLAAFSRTFASVNPETGPRLMSRSLPVSGDVKRNTHRRFRRYSPPPSDRIDFGPAFLTCLSVNLLSFVVRIGDSNFLSLLRFSPGVSPGL
jgi:hypothetical protein